MRDFIRDFGAFILRFNSLRSGGEKTLSAKSIRDFIRDLSVWWGFSRDAQGWGVNHNSLIELINLKDPIICKKGIFSLTLSAKFDPVFPKFLTKSANQ